MYALIMLLMFLLEFSILRQKIPILFYLILPIILTFIFYLTNRAMRAQQKKEK